MKVGITERGDAGIDFSWQNFVASVDMMILITKAPQNLVGQVLSPKTVVHCTITGLGNSRWEPNVEKPELTLSAYRSLIEKYGSERVVLRVDPILPFGNGVSIAKSVIANALGRVRISFMDAYRHVRNRISEQKLAEIPWKGLHAPLENRLKILEDLKKEFQTIDFEICGEPGISCTGCVSVRDLLACGFKEFSFAGKSYQREECMCLAEKTELLSNRSRCKHKCVYCYWKDK